MRRSLAGHGAALIATALLLALSGCAGAPVQEMSDARQAINAARAAGAAETAPEPLAQATELLASAEQALQKHDYRTARRQAEEAHAQAVTALNLASKATKP
jgi:hypothetical protein